MGVMKKYRGYRALECVAASTETAQIASTMVQCNTIDFKMTDGTSKTSLGFNQSYYGALGLFLGSNITVIASADELDDYTGDEYQNDGIGTVTIKSNTLTRYANKVSRIIEVEITNTEVSDISVGSIKVLHAVNSGNSDNILCLGYYFSTPFTLTPNESVIKTLRFDFGAE